MRIGIAGAGTMGIGIAQVVVMHGDEAMLYDDSQEQLEKSMSFLDNMLCRQVTKDKMSEDEKNVMLQKVVAVNALNDFSHCDMVIEAIVEKLTIKQQLFSALENIVRRDCILASNTSSLSISSLAGQLNNPDRMLGVHFFNPAPLMPLVEIIPTLLTEASVTSQVKERLVIWKKHPVIAKDTPGFIVNRIARSFYGESLRIYEEGIADFPFIDWAMKKYGGFKMGPFELTDLIGQDINNAVSETVFQSMYFDGRYKPSITQKRMTELRLLGRKTGRGFYAYTEGKKQEVDIVPNEQLGKTIVDRVLTMLINEAVDALYLQIASKEDIDLAMKKGVNYPKGLLEWCDELGAQRVFHRLRLLHNTYCEERYRPSPLLAHKAANDQSFY